MGAGVEKDATQMQRVPTLCVSLQAPRPARPLCVSVASPARVTPRAPSARFWVANTPTAHPPSHGQHGQHRRHRGSKRKRTVTNGSIFSLFFSDERLFSARPSRKAMLGEEKKRGRVQKNDATLGTLGTLDATRFSSLRPAIERTELMTRDGLFMGSTENVLGHGSWSTHYRGNKSLNWTETKAETEIETVSETWGGILGGVAPSFSKRRGQHATGHRSPATGNSKTIRPDRSDMKRPFLVRGKTANQLRAATLATLRHTMPHLPHDHPHSISRPVWFLMYAIHATINRNVPELYAATSASGAAAGAAAADSAAGLD